MADFQRGGWFISKGIVDLRLPITLSRMAVFRAENPTTRLQRARDDHCLPEGGLERLLGPDGDDDVPSLRRLRPPVPEATEHVRRFSCGEGTWNLARDRHVLFLEHLEPHPTSARTPQALRKGAGGLAAPAGGPVMGANEDVGIHKRQPGYPSGPVSGHEGAPAPT